MVRARGAHEVFEKRVVLIGWRKKLRAVQVLEVQIDIVPRLFEFVGPGVEIHTVEGLPLVSIDSVFDRYPVERFW